MANYIKLEGWGEFQDKLKKLPADVIQTVDLYVRDAAEDWEERAKLAAPVDQGFLRNNIKSFHLGSMNAEVVSSMNYSAYVEWGTGARVSVPSGLQEYAIQFKGKKITIGRYPSPFFFPQKPIVERELIANIKRELETPR